MHAKPLRPGRPPEDDGRTIASMNIEGMPWHTVTPSPAPETHGAPGTEPLRGKALRQYMVSAVGAGLLVTLLFGAAGAALILFCTQVWFR